MEERRWSHLPDTALIEIYLCLQDKDKIKMAMTCKNWNRIYGYPCLWRTRYIELGGYKAISAGYKACKFADMHGAHLKNLFFSCNHPSGNSCKIIQMNIDNFLYKIRTSKLINFEFLRFSFWKFENLKEKVVNSFVRFFRSQRNLLNFDMGNTHFSQTSGCQILEAVGSSSGATIKDLDIEDFFHSRLAMFQERRFRNAFSKFTNLSYVSLNYSCLSDEIFESMAKSLAGKLKTISCTIYKTDPYRHRISPTSWKRLTSVCPKLSLDLWFESIGKSVYINRILVPEAPVREMHLRTGFDHNVDWHFTNTIDHIAIHHKQIALLSIELDNNHEFIDSHLLNMVTACTCLRELFVNAVLNVATIDEICTLQREGRIGLQKFHVTACGLSELECTQLALIRDKHIPSMQDRGLDFQLSSDSYTNFIDDR